jgi:hypothetical protein
MRLAGVNTVLTFYVSTELPLTEQEKLLLRLLRWKANHPSTSASALDDLQNVFGSCTSWYRCVSLAKQLAHDVTINEHPMCPDSHYAWTDQPIPTTAEEKKIAACLHCDKLLYHSSKPIKTYPTFPLGPRLSRQWLSSARAALLRNRHQHCETINGQDSVIRDFVDADVYNERDHAARFPDEYTHALAISMDGFQIFKQ